MENKNLRTSILPQASGLRTRVESGGAMAPGGGGGSYYIIVAISRISP